MTLPATVAITLPPLVNPDFSMPIAANDRSGFATISDDFIFDAMDPNCYSGGVLPAVSAAMPTAGLVNLANDTALAISRTAAAGAVTAIPSDGTKLPTFSGKGLRFLSGTCSPLNISKIGTTISRVAEPVLEGNVPFLDIVFFKINTFANAVSPYCAGLNNSTSRYGGFITTSAGGLIGAFPNQGTTIQPTASTWMQLACYHTFDPVGLQTTLRLYLNGAFLASDTGSWTNTQGSANSSARAQIGGVAGANVMDGEVARVRRVYTTPWLAGLSGPASLAAIDALVANEYGWKMPLLNA